MPSKPTYSRKAKNTVKKVVKYANTGRKYAGYAALAYKVGMLAAAVNAEKKIYSVTGTGLTFAQVSANLNAFYAFDATPLPAQGTTSITRNGNSIKPHSAIYRFQFQQGSAVANPIKIKILVLAVKGQPQPVGTYPTTILDPNPWITGNSIVDYNSNFSSDYFGTFTIVKTKTCILEPDNFTGQTMIKDVSFGVKYPKDFHVKFSADGSTNIAKGQLIVVFLADSGNNNGTTVSTLGGIPITTAGTGVLSNYHIQHYYYDN